jgi:hypothetical protein
MNRKLFVAAAVACAVVFFDSHADVASNLLALADQHAVKVVWSRGMGSEFGFAGRYSTGHALMKFDTETGREDTLCLADEANPKFKSNVTRPVISHDGSRVLFSNAVDSSVWIIKWDGTGKRHIAKGIAGCLWFDSTTNKEYAIYAKNASLECLAAVWRVNIDDTTDTKELLPKSIFANTSNQVINPIWIDISKDGTNMVIGTGWPQITMYSLITKATTGGAGGCWPSLPRDNSYSMVVFVLSHDGFNIYPSSSSGEPSRYLSPSCPWNNKPCGENQLNFPKMSSNNPCFMALIDSRAETSGQGPGNVMVFKFDSALTTFKGSAVVTSSRMDGFCDVWINPDMPTGTPEAGVRSAIKTASAGIPLTLTRGNCPEIIFTLDKPSAIDIAIFSLDGRSVGQISGDFSAGTHRCMISGDEHFTRTMYLVRQIVNGAQTHVELAPVF